MTKLFITLLAGGLGKRMLSDIPKVLHKVKGEPMIIRLINQIIFLNPDKIFIVVGKFHQLIQNEIEKVIIDKKIIYVDQETPLGTGDAVKCTLPYFNQQEQSINIILNGDVPLLQFSTIKEIYDYYLQIYSKFLITSTNLQNPTGNGRIIIDDENHFKEIVEEKDCTIEQKLINLVNCGIYICHSDVLLNFVPLIKNDNAQKEYYLTDLVKIYLDHSNDHKIDLFFLSSAKQIEIYNVNTKDQLNFIDNQTLFN